MSRPHPFLIICVMIDDCGSQWSRSAAEHLTPHYQTSRRPSLHL
jgi:hypothetical protein